VEGPVCRDPNVVGKDIRLSGTPYRIVGVMPATFGIPGDDDVRVYTAFAFTQQQTSDQARTATVGDGCAAEAGVSLAQAQERINDLNRRNLDIFPSFAQYSSVRASPPR